MSDPLIRTRTPAEILAYVAEKLREQPDATALLAHSMTLEMLAEEFTADPLSRLNRALADLGMPTAVLTVTTGRDLSGWPEAVIRLVHADDPEYGYGEIRIPLRIKDGDDA